MIDDSSLDHLQLLLTGWWDRASVRTLREAIRGGRGRSRSAAGGWWKRANIRTFWDQLQSSATAFVRLVEESKQQNVLGPAPIIFNSFCQVGGTEHHSKLWETTDKACSGLSTFWMMLCPTNTSQHISELPIYLLSIIVSQYIVHPYSAGRMRGSDGGQVCGGVQIMLGDGFGISIRSYLNKIWR